MFGEPRKPQGSLFLEVLDWMFLPLIVVWPVSVVVTYFVAHAIADKPFDRDLARSVQALAGQVIARDGLLILQALPPALTLPADDAQDAVFFQVSTADGRLVAGDAGLPAPAFDADSRPGEVGFRNDSYRGAEVRVAFLLASPPGLPEASPLLIQVAETSRRRNALASEIVTGVILPQFFVVPLAVILVWFGLRRGIQPLKELAQRMRGRDPGDLSPIPEEDAPEEVRPLVASMNDLMLRLQRLLSAQQRFVADAAHQLRTPVAGLKTQAQLALRQSSDEEIRASLQQIAAGSDRAGRLINQLLALARAEAGEQKGGPMAPLDLDRLVQEALADWHGRALQASQELAYEGPEAPVTVLGNPALLRELLGNLVDNAIRYTPAGGAITVRLRAGDGAMLEVEDSGIGIAPEAREMVFERFYRVLGTGTEGSGLGLAIVRSIAAAHGGGVTVAAGSGGRGTRFVVRLPVLSETTLPSAA